MYLFIVRQCRPYLCCWWPCYLLYRLYQVGIGFIIGSLKCFEYGNIDNYSVWIEHYLLNVPVYSWQCRPYLCCWWPCHLLYRLYQVGIGFIIGSLKCFGYGNIDNYSGYWIHVLGLIDDCALYGVVRSYKFEVITRYKCKYHYSYISTGLRWLLVCKAILQLGWYVNGKYPFVWQL